MKHFTGNWVYHRLEVHTVFTVILYQLPAVELSLSVHNTFGKYHSPLVILAVMCQTDICHIAVVLNLCGSGINFYIFVSLFYSLKVTRDKRA